MATLSHPKTAAHRQIGFSAMEKWVLAALLTLPLSSVLLITDGFHGIASHWL